MDEKKPSSGTTDLTTGRPLWRILVFALPLVLGTVFQQLYSFADTVIVGRCLGTDALAAVGSTYSLNFLILGFIQGACVGFGIPVVSVGSSAAAAVSSRATIAARAKARRSGPSCAGPAPTGSFPPSRAPASPRCAPPWRA